MGGGEERERGQCRGLIVVRVCKPVFRNLPHSYTLPGGGVWCGKGVEYLTSPGWGGGGGGGGGDG